MKMLTSFKQKRMKKDILPQVCNEKHVTCGHCGNCVHIETSSLSAEFETIIDASVFV